MKKIIAAVLMCVMALALLAGCKKDQMDVSITVQPGNNAASPDTGSLTVDNDDSDANSGGAQGVSTDPSIPAEPSFALPDNFVENLVSLVTPFNTAPQEFETADSLTDETLVFTAASYLDSSFAPNEDGISYSLPLDDLVAGVTRLYGGKVALSATYTTKSYIPYIIDAEQNLIFKYPASGVGSYYFTYALIEIDGGYELWLIDLMDDLYFGEESNRDYLYEGNEVTWDMISSYAHQMQMNVYTIRQTSSQDYYIAAFRYVNFKNINHYIF